MTRLQWIFAGVSAGAAGALAVALAVAPAGPTAATAVAPASAPTPAVATSAPVTPAPTQVAPAAPRIDAEVRPATVPTAPPSGSAGMVVAIDPETGALGMPSAEQLSELKLSDDETSSRGGGVLVHHANGMVSLDLQGRNQDYAVVKKAKDGTNVIGCVERPEDAAYLEPTPTALEEE